jgi:hypothetical protein
VVALLNKYIPFLFLVLLSASVFAVDLTCGFYSGSCPSTPILYLANQTANFSNAHTQLPTYATYSQMVCCDSAKYSLGTSSSGAGIARLHSQTNSHIELFNESDYASATYLSTNSSVPYCTTAVNGDCDPIYTCLFSISSNTNAHLADCDSTYVNKICCKTRDVPTLNVTYTVGTLCTIKEGGTAGITYTLKREGALVSNPDTSILTSGNYTYTCNTTENENFTAGYITQVVDVQKIVPSGMYMIYNAINSVINSTDAYMNVTIIGIGCPTELTCNLYYDDVNITNPSSLLVPVSTSHVYKYNTTGNANYSAVNVVYTTSVGNTSSTTVIVSGSSANSGGVYAQPTVGCTYSFSKPVYYLGDTVELSFSCPMNMNEWYTSSWNDNKGVLYYTSVGTIKALNTITYTPLKDMVGNVSVKIGSTTFSAGYVVQSTHIMALFSGTFGSETLNQNRGYIYMLILVAVILLGIYYMDLFIKIGQRNATIKNITVGLFLFLCSLVGIGIYLYATNNTGYLYMGLLFIGMLIIFLILNSLIKKSGEKR